MCLEEQQDGGFHLSRVANFCLTTSTGNINEHLFDKHEIVVESSSSITPLTGRGNLNRRGTKYRGPKGRERGGVLGEGAASPSPPARGWESAVSSASGVWGGAPAEIEFGAFLPKMWHLVTGDYKWLTLTD